MHDQPRRNRHTFEHDYPTKEAAQRARDDAEYQRALIAYRFWYPTVSIEGFFNGNRQIGIQDNQALALGSCTPHWVAFTGNADTPYALGALDLKVVVEIPSGPFVSVIDDHDQRWVVDMGLPGPDKAKGGNYLILPPEYKGEPPASYHVARSSTFKVFFVLRVIPQPILAKTPRDHRL
jgi:hypothetical protein